MRVQNNENNNILQSEHEFNQKSQLKHRLTGAGVWLLLLVIIVPTWYANPVEFDPEGIQENIVAGKIVTKAYKLSGEKNLVLSAEDNMAAVKNKKLLEIKSEKQSNWLVKIAAYKIKQKAEEINDRLRYSYKSYIKYFPKSQYYSLRVGPYEDKEEALKDQQKLNKLLHIKTNLVKM